jgi:hypothetical protein
MFGARAAAEMSLDELLVLEKHLEIWIYQIRSTKVSNYFQANFTCFKLLLLFYIYIYIFFILFFVSLTK